ncbi:MAG: hypothetical protein Fur0014_21730 [Rubrivivax sp.]
MLARTVLPKLLVAAALAFAAGAAPAADECRVTITHLGDGATRRPLLSTVAVLSVGDVTRQEIDWLDALRNDGPHDVHATLAGAPNRQLRRGQTDPAQGRYGGRVKLLRLECLPSRAAAALHLSGTDRPGVAVIETPASLSAPTPTPLTNTAQRLRADAHHPH